MKNLATSFEIITKTADRGF